MRFSNLVLLVLHAARPSRSFDVPVVGPGAPMEGERAIISFAEDQTTEDRHASLMKFQEQGHACWMIPNHDEAALCIQSSTSTYVEIPKNAESFRRILAEVNLSAWLPSLVCHSRSQASGRDSTAQNWTGGNEADQTACYKAVKASLAAQEHVEVLLTWEDSGGIGQNHRVSATIDEKPWVKVLQSVVAIRSEHKVDAFACNAAIIALASRRAKDQLLPALRILARQQTSSLPSLKVLSTVRIQSLLTLLGSRSGNETKKESSLRITSPRPRGRVSGSVVPFTADLHLGLASTSDVRTTTAKATKGVMTEQEVGVDTVGNDGSREERSGERSEIAAPLSTSAVCEVRVMVDGAIASTVPIDVTAASSGDDIVAVQTAVIPTYGQMSHCSEHPANAAILEAAGGKSGIWDMNEEVWRLQAGAVDRVCTRQASGTHRVYSELACRDVARDTMVTEPYTRREGDSITRPEEATSRQSEPTLAVPEWEVLATSATVEYFHTGISVNEAVSKPWIPDAEEKDRDDESENMLGKGAAGSLFYSPPEELSVTLYVEDDPDNTVETIEVARWFSDGEVWEVRFDETGGTGEVAFDVCSNAFGPLQGVLINTNNCVDLVTDAVAAERADIFNMMSLRLEDYLGSVNPTLSFEGHTGNMPEKVEALGAMARNGGARVSRICEVGFNAGHSSLNWLLNSHPSTKVLAFDLGEHDYVKHALEFLQAVFPGRLDVVVGDSTSTVPAYADAEEAAGRDPRVCDMVFVDGAHTQRGVSSDLTNFRALANRGWNMLAIDDMDIPSVKRAWHVFSDSGGGMLERVVKSTGEHLSYTREGEHGTWDVRTSSRCHRRFIVYGHFALGLGRFNIA